MSAANESTDSAYHHSLFLLGTVARLRSATAFHGNITTDGGDGSSGTMALIGAV
jgi:hypothetical protein